MLIPPAPGYLQAACSGSAASTTCCFVADEVITGFGRHRVDGSPPSGSGSTPDLITRREGHHLGLRARSAA